MPPRKSNISQISATDPDGAGTPLKERDGINIEVQPSSQFLVHPASQVFIPYRPLLPGPPPGISPPLSPFPHGNPHPMVADKSDIYGPQDLSLPKTMVQRLAKGVLPPNTSLGKDAIMAMQKGATVFVNYLAQAANTSTTNANKRTIPPPAVLEALVDLEFDSFVPRVEAELNKYNEVQVGKRNEYRRKVKEEKMGGGRGEEEGGEIEEEGRAAKRVRREEGEGVEVNGNGIGNGEVGDGHEQLQVGGGYAEVEEGDEEFDAQGDGVGDEDTANTSRELRPGRSEEGEGEEEGEEEEEEEEVEDEEEDDDEDEYPDEGRRLSSVEREAHEGRGGRYVDDNPMEEGDEDEEGLSDVSD